MTEQYKIGDKVLVEAVVKHAHYPDGLYLDIKGTKDAVWFQDKMIRPYTPRQEFEYGEVVEVRNNEGSEWLKTWYIGKSNNKKAVFPYIVNKDCDGLTSDYSCFKYCRKLTTKKETITIGGVDYYKDDVEKALKDLKPVEGK